MNYMNSEKQIQQIIITLCGSTAGLLLEDEYIPENEKEHLRKIIEYVDKFNNSVFERLGSSYKKSIINKTHDNTVRIVSRYSHTESNMQDNIDEKELRDIIDSNTDIDCCGCDRTDCKNCNIYNIKSRLGYNGISDKTDLCPFRKPEMEFKDFDEL